jgi:hypothetical protein
MRGLRDRSPHDRSAEDKGCADPETRGAGRRSYAPRMKRLRAFLDRLPGGHRPPTGPLTTAEQNDAEELRQETLLDDQRIEREREEQRSSSRQDD